MADSRGEIVRASVVASLLPDRAHRTGRRRFLLAARVAKPRLRINPTAPCAQGRQTYSKEPERLRGNLLLSARVAGEQQRPGPQLTLGTKSPQPRLFPTRSMRF
jgi:hypothetical protein